MPEHYERAVFVGGHLDGQEMTLPAGTDLWRTLAPMPSPIVFDPDPSPDDHLHPLRTVEYRVRLDHGWPARRDDGRLVFELYRTHGGPPPKPAPPAPERRCRPHLENLGYPVTITCSCGVPVGTAADKVELGRVLDLAKEVHDW